MMDFLMLAYLKRFSSIGVLLMRVVVGAFLLWGIWDILPSHARMRGFAALLSKYNFPLPYLMACLSIYAQAFIGMSFVIGLFVRWAGLLCAVNFAVRWAMIDRFGDIQNAFPTACLIAIGIFLALYGAGLFSIDELLEPRARQRFDSHY